MPLPLAHTAISLTLYVAMRDKTIATLPNRKRTWLVCLVVLLGSFADFDFLPGILIGDPNRFHHGVSHSLITMLGVASVCYCATSRFYVEVNQFRLFVLFALVAFSHPLLDMLSVDILKPYGVPLFWPIDYSYQISPISVFSDIRRSGTTIESLFWSLFNEHNARAVVGEGLFAAALLSAIVWYKHQLGPVKTAVCWVSSVTSGILLYAFYMTFLRHA